MDPAVRNAELWGRGLIKYHQEFEWFKVRLVTLVIVYRGNGNVSKNWCRIDNFAKKIVHYTVRKNENLKRMHDDQRIQRSWIFSSSRFE